MERMTKESRGAGGKKSRPGKPRKAIAVEKSIKTANAKRLRRIEGQIRGLQKMVAEERYCADILMQIASVQEALRAVGGELMRNHLRHCVSTTLRTGSAKQVATVQDELLQLMRKYSR